MSNKIVLDSSILVEYRKGVQTLLLESIISNELFVPLISQVVVSEYLYYHIAIFSGKSPMTIKSSGEIGKYLSLGDPNGFLEQFEMLQDFPMIAKDASLLMRTYNLLPNDSLILATCQYYDINYLASYDTDYRLACKDLGIQFISSNPDFESILI